MTTGLKVALALSAAMLAAFGIEAAYIHYDRNRPYVSPTKQEAGPTDPDDLVYLRHAHPETPADLKDLVGHTVWIKAGGQMDYFPATGHRADYAQPAGLLPGGAALKIADTFQQVRPATRATRVPPGNSQVLLSFTMPGSADPAKLYAAPIGYRDASGYTFFADDIFFYDDPHTLYNWPQPVWQAIDQHQAIAGMNQRQVSLALGAVAHLSSGSMTDGQIVYNNSGHPIEVTFAHGRVTSAQPAAAN